MQARAGTRGAKDYEADSLDIDFYAATILNDTAAAYLPDRNISFNIDTANFNLRDQIRQGENFPLQFIYEAADCRIFYTFNTIFDLAALWQYAADAIWINPGLCVQDSTNQPSSGKVTDTIGPNLSQKAAWDATNPEVPSYAIENATSINLAQSFVPGIDGPDDDIAGAPGSLCSRIFNTCGQLTCAEAPYCDGQTGRFILSQLQCVRSCSENCLPGETCERGASCLSGSGKCDICQPKVPITSRTCVGRRTTKDRQVNIPKGHGFPKVGKAVENIPKAKEVDIDQKGQGGVVAKSIMRAFRG